MKTLAALGALLLFLCPAIYLRHGVTKVFLEPMAASAAATEELIRLGYRSPQIEHVNVNDDGSAWVIADCNNERVDVRLTNVTTINSVVTGVPWGNRNLDRNGVRK